MRRVFIIIYSVVSIILLLYLFLPQPEFPRQIVNSLQSSEPADVETPLRRGYYVYGERADVIGHYEKEFSKITIFGYVFQIPGLRLNYPPEESQTIIRDQTRSTYLEEIVHPLRESIFISGFEPKENKDVIVVDGVKYDQKVIVRYYQSNVYFRLSIGVGIVIFGYLIVFSCLKAICKYKPLLKR